MDYRKVDANLAGALDEVTNPERKDLTVFIHTVDGADLEQADYLRTRGVGGASTGGSIFTATVSAAAVDELSEQPWIRSLQLSHRLRPLEHAPAAAAIGRAYP